MSTGAVMEETYDLVAIGAGPAGESAVELAAFYGFRSVVISCESDPADHAGVPGPERS